MGAGEGSASSSKVPMRCSGLLSQARPSLKLHSGNNQSASLWVSSPSVSPLCLSVLLVLCLISQGGIDVHTA